MKSVVHQRRSRNKRLHLTRLILVSFICVLPFIVLLRITNEKVEVLEESTLYQELTHLNERLRDVESFNRDRMGDINALRQDIRRAFQMKPTSRKQLNSDVYLKNSSVYVGRETLWQKQSNPYQSGGQFFVDDRVPEIQLPSLRDFLPHLNHFDGLHPSLQITSSRNGVSLVLGIPTVKRPVHGYLLSTLQNLIDNLNEEEKQDTLLIVLIAEIDRSYVEKEADEIRSKFQSYLDSGLLEVISPPENYYPDFTSLRNTIGDPIERVRWRTKQNLDYAYLMMYAQAKGTFYVQLEDDILTKPRYATTMKAFAYKQIRENKDWIVLDFCQLGFIGKMFKSVDLSKLVTFFAIFHNDKPVDWLLDHMIQTKVCRFDRDRKDCKRQKDGVWIHYRPSLFQHVGTHSSLKGKVQKLKDKQFGKMAVYYPHRNPVATLQTSLKTYKTYNLQKTYKGESFFWAKRPLAGDNITIHFESPVLLERFHIRTGSSEHPEDILTNATVHVLPVLPPKFPDLIPYPNTADKYLIIGNFYENLGVSEGTVVPTVGPVSTMRISVDADSDHWLVVSEIVLETAPVEALIESAFNMSSTTLFKMMGNGTRTT